MDAVAESLVAIVYFLGKAGKGLQLSGDGRYHRSIDAPVSSTVLLEGGLAVEVRVPDQGIRAVRV